MFELFRLSVRCACQFFKEQFLLNRKRVLLQKPTQCSELKIFAENITPACAHYAIHLLGEVEHLYSCLNFVFPVVIHFVY